MSTEAEEIQRIRTFWNTREDRLSDYTAERSLVRRLRRKNREGRYMLESFVLLVIFAWVATWTGGSPTWTRVLSAGLPIGYLLDSVLVNTSIVFITRSPIHPLRSVLLTFLAFVNVGVAFAAIYALEQSLKSARGLDEFVYFSFIHPSLGIRVLPGDVSVWNEDAQASAPAIRSFSSILQPAARRIAIKGQIGPDRPTGPSSIKLVPPAGSAHRWNTPLPIRLQGWIQ